MSKSKSSQKLSERYSSKSGGDTSSLKGKLLSKPAFIAGAVVVLVGGCALAVTSMSGSESKDAEVSNSYNLVVTPDDVEEAINEEGVVKAAPGTYDVCMNSTWHFPDARSASEGAYVENLITNHNTVSFIVKRDDNDAVIYESPYIPVGSHLENIVLSDTSLPKGTYPCTLVYSLLDEDYQELSTVNLSISIVIAND